MWKLRRKKIRQHSLYFLRSYSFFFTYFSTVLSISKGFTIICSYFLSVAPGTYFLFDVFFSSVLFWSCYKRKTTKQKKKCIASKDAKVTKSGRERERERKNELTCALHYVPKNYILACVVLLRSYSTCQEICYDKNEF